MTDSADLTLHFCNVNICVDILYYITYNMRNEIILDNNAKGSESMVFNTGAALLDAIVLGGSIAGR